MPKFNFEKEAKEDFDMLIEKYDNVILCLDPKINKSGKSVVSMNCPPYIFCALLDELLTAFLKEAEDKKQYKEYREMIRIVVAHAETRCENSEKKIKASNALIDILFKNLFTPDEEDDNENEDED